MSIPEPDRTSIFCYLTNDTKDAIDQLARYYKTTKTSLMEEGAQMVIRSRLQQIHDDTHNARQVSSVMDTSVSRLVG